MIATLLAALLLTLCVLVSALDLGVGLLLPLVARGRDRDAVLAVAGRSWSAGALWTFVVFALAIAGLPASLVALRALWPPLALMLAALALRGAASAIRPHVLHPYVCDLAFGLASLAAVACQGLVLGWAVGALGPDLPARHAGPFGWASIWGLLFAGVLTGIHGLIGAGWLIWSGRGSVRVFGREVGHAAALLVAGSMVPCAPWALLTGVAARVAAHGWGRAVAPAALGVIALTAAVPFWLSLWGRRPAVPLACAVLSSLCGLAAAATLPWPALGSGRAEGYSAAYLAFVLLIGSPLIAIDLRGRLATLRTGAEPARKEGPSHAGRRSGSLANSLHLS